MPTSSEKIESLLKRYQPGRTPARKNTPDGAASPQEKAVDEAMCRVGSVQDRLWAMKNALKMQTPLEAVAAELAAIGQTLATGGSPAAATAQAVASEETLAMAQKNLTAPQVIDYALGEIMNIVKTRDPKRYRSLVKTIRVAKESFQDTEAPSSVPVIDTDSGSDTTAAGERSEELIDPPWKAGPNAGKNQYEGKSGLDQPEAHATRTPGSGPGTTLPDSGKNAGETNYNGSSMLSDNSAAMMTKRIEERLQALKKNAPAAPEGEGRPEGKDGSHDGMGAPWPRDLGNPEFLSGKDEVPLPWGKDTDPWK